MVHPVKALTKQVLKLKAPTFIRNPKLLAKVVKSYPGAQKMNTWYSTLEALIWTIWINKKKIDLALWVRKRISLPIQSQLFNTSTKHKIQEGPNWGVIARCWQWSGPHYMCVEVQMPIIPLAYFSVAFSVQERMSIFANKHMTTMQSQCRWGHIWHFCNNLH